jgi:hypothetical protein
MAAGLRKERRGAVTWADPLSNPLGLTQNQLRYAVAYVAHPEANASQVARIAGFKHAGNIAKRMLRHKLVLQEIARRRKLEGEPKAEGDDLRELLRAIINADPIDLFVSGYRGKLKLKAWEEIEPGIRRAIKAMRVLPDGTIEVEMFDKISAVYLLGRDFGLFQEAQAPAEPAREPADGPTSAQAEAAPPTPEPPRPRRTLEQLLAERRNGTVHDVAPGSG